MCEMFGVSSPRKIYLNNLLCELFSHGDRHPQGWGMAFFYNGSVSLEKQPETSTKSRYLKQRLSVGINADEMIAHIRLATKGSMDYENTHPFVLRDCSGRAWTLAHNGTIFECGLMDRFVLTQQGSTDSERILMYIIDQINAAIHEKGSQPDCQERFAVIDRIIHEITPENKVNLLLHDGEMLYAHTNFKDTLYYRYDGDAFMVSTTMLGKGGWEKMPMNTLIAVNKGRIVYTGTAHNNEFFNTEEKMRMLFLDYASL